MREFFDRHRFMLLCFVLLWVKTVIVSLVTFDLMINHPVEIVLFILNPLAFLLIVFSAGLLLKASWQRPYFVIVSTLLAVVLYSNTVYYREFADVITLPMLVMSGNAGDLSTSVFELIQWWDVIFFADIFVLFWLWRKKPAALPVHQVPFRARVSRYGYVAGAAVLIVLLTQIEVTEAETPVHAFDRQQVIKNLGLYNFYFYDMYQHVTTGTQTVTSDESDFRTIADYVAEHSVEPSSEWHGAAEGRNVVMVSMESVESFTIGRTLNGEEITPFLNELMEEDTLYFENFFDQAGQGKTSDTEFMLNNGLYPVGRGAVFHTHPEVTLTPMLQELREEGYANAAFHANDATFYNRNNVYPRLGYDVYHDIESYNVTDENSVGWGLKDMEFVEQSMPYIEELSEPFFATLLTLTNHFPYELDEEDSFIAPAETESDIVNRYFPTVRYTDEAMRLLVERFKEAGLYEDTIFIFYGDHYGLAQSHYEELGTLLDTEIDPYDAVMLDRVPLFIHMPGMEQEAQQLETIGGPVDVMPTLLNLLGQPQENHFMFGRDLLSDEREGFAVMRNGAVVTEDVVYTSGELCFDTATGGEEDLSACVDAAERGETELTYSDQLIYGDLLRFFEKPE